MGFLTMGDFFKRTVIPIFLTINLVYFIIPMMYLYTVRLSDTRTSRDYLHFFLPVGVLLYCFVRYFTLSDHGLLISSLPLDMFLIFQSGLIVNNGYIFMMSRLIRSYRCELEDNYSSIRHVRLKWLSIILLTGSIATLLFFISNMAGYFIPGFLPFLFSAVDFFSFFLILVFLLSISYFSFLQPEINLEPYNKKKAPVYEKQRLPESLENTFLKQLLDYMEEEKPYLNPDLSIRQLADEVSIPSAHLTMILNVLIKQNFYYFINGYRIKAACRMLEQKDDRTILTIAMDSGFNSKTTFNTFFKKSMQMTPSEYRRLHV